MLGDGDHLIGHSWGGAEALLAAARRPGGTNDDTTSSMISNYDADAATRFGCSILRARMAPPPVLLRAAATVAAVASVTARLTGGRHASVPSANHCPQLENAGEFNRVIDAFMNESASAH